ncbi:MAG: bifunctional phosphoserine phosphatase/homoserine phosphotransferase ThrH [Spirochaetaceae bacterium]|nr:bifunctional phosphoserine phosphatase/homoserine phosphotransferase ThrH [Spirochaetaceae bacterium]
MRIVCLDLEGVLVPEIWIAFAQSAGIPELERTTRDEPDYAKLMAFRLEILNRHNLKLPDIQKVIGGMEPLAGALDFCDALRSRAQLIILSDTFEQFAAPLMKKLGYPTLFCNTLETAPDGRITGWKLRQNDGKRRVVDALSACNIEVFAAGDSYNDLAMIKTAKAGCLFRAPEAIQKANAEVPCVKSYDALLLLIEQFLC